MFSKRKPFKVKLKGRAGLVYEEHGKLMSVDSEMLAGPNYDIVIYGDSIQRWNPPYHARPLSNNDKQRIKVNIAEALSQLRIYWS